MHSSTYPMLVCKIILMLAVMFSLEFALNGQSYIRNLHSTDSLVISNQPKLSLQAMRAYIVGNNQDLQLQTSADRFTLFFAHQPVLPVRRQSFFCEIESLIEKKSVLAPRLRLGSLDYVNWLEGKTSF